MAERKSILLRLDPSVHDALARWAAAELRSTNAQIEYLLRNALAERGLLPSRVGEIRRPGRPRTASETPPDGQAADAQTAEANDGSEQDERDRPPDPPDDEPATP